ncbi:flagellar filament capping protein FliD [Undibacterium sp.]|jgi:flagellar hook-associated protein 2|uniref:flagellar filament capping protein FliD n=1 Tax=Undibacterium sp. TaxID=1914977 RepID=UPI002C90F796|nr:flagellar filament capping protein FliD [Undibacterium sp.]HTD04166.1 flagellar filament capping protein FliD [Undibacterium sp.]
MTTTSSSTTKYDPATTASQLATAYTADRQAMLTQQTTNAKNTVGGLTKLQSALTAFESAINTLSAKNGVQANSASFNNTSVGTATATAAATAGSYSFFVEKLATANQLTYSGLTNVGVASGDVLKVSLAGGASFNVNLAAADTNGDGLTAKEIAAAINAAAGNNSSVTASTVTVGGQSQLVLQSSATGLDGKITLDTSQIAAGALKTALSAGTELVPAQDAVIWLGDKDTGIRLQQASNTYNAIDGVSMNFTKAMATGDQPVTLTVAMDTANTATNVQSFVTAYNTLQGVLGGLTSVGDPTNKVAAGIFANDTGLGVLNSRLGSAIRQNIGGLTLANYGITANRDGTLSLDQGKLTKKMASNPNGLDNLFGKTTLGAQTGIFGDMDKYLALWTNSATGQITQRQSSVTKLQTSLTDRQATLDTQYNSAYQRYLLQFTQLQTLQAQMSQTTGIFDALFSTSGN